MVNPALVTALRSRKDKRGPKIGTFRTKLSISPGLYIHLNWLAKTELRGPGRHYSF